MRIVCASANPHKVEEIARLLPSWVELVARPSDIGDIDDVFVAHVEVVRADHLVCGRERQVSSSRDRHVAPGNRIDVGDAEPRHIQEPDVRQYDVAPRCR